MCGDNEIKFYYFSLLGEKTVICTSEDEILIKRTTILLKAKGKLHSLGSSKPLNPADSKK